MSKYFTGGLEPLEDDIKILPIDDTDYLITDKFKTMLRDSFIDWGTFLEVYHGNLNASIMFEQILKLLNIKENENLRDIMVPLVKKIYHLPLSSHMACMLKQFVVYEPVSLAVHSLFTTIKHHYEHIVKRFVFLRNRYIEEHDLKAKLNNWDKLYREWEEANLEYGLETSSIILLFLNPPHSLKSGLHYKIPGKDMSALKSAVKSFHYKGFCPKIPHERLTALLAFPINAFVSAIKSIAPDEPLPNYRSIEQMVANTLRNKPVAPEIKDEVKRETPPKGMDKLRLIQWYVDHILELRKNLLPYGKQYEEYYISMAKTITEITEKIKNELTRQELPNQP